MAYASMNWFFRLLDSFSLTSLSTISATGIVALRAFVPTSSRLRTLTDLDSSSVSPTTGGED